MPILFSYGSLQRDDVQVASFGRVLPGWPDELVGFTLVPAGAHSPHANVVRGSEGSRVPGHAFEISDTDLAAADEYERRDAYTRIRGRLASGKETWVFVSRVTA